MQKTIFDVRGMDCPSEENMIRMKLDGLSSIHHLEFDLPSRMLTVYHDQHIDEIENALRALHLGEKRLSTQQAAEYTIEQNKDQRKLLIVVLLINFIFFLIEMTTGLLSRSMGLVADSLDMLADAFVYGISLFAVGGSIFLKKKIARLAGYFQIVLASIGFLEVIRRWFFGIALPDFSTMIIVSVFALLANAICLYLLQRSKGKQEAHMQASMIFTSNDIIINAGVIVAGVLVLVLNSNIPDLIIGSIVFALVVRGAVRILKLGK